MQFFEHQDQARGRTSLLIVLFVMAVLALGLFSASVTHLALTWNKLPEDELSPYHTQLVSCAAIGTWGVIVLGSLFKTASLRGGGKRVAESLGGNLAVACAQDDLKIKRALNVVEEMAIAASLPVPPLYVLHRESGINAFAAGWSIDDAVIGITQGALDTFTRDELQGVVAHEFSHILNRDCALNMRLLGVLHGIVVISTIGRVVMRMTSGSRHSSTRREGGAIQIFIIGAAIWLFGSLGVLIARLIQSAVSQQREFLADASAVQFTRNPLGLAGALAKIGSQSSALSSPYAAESSHMLIGAPNATGFSGLLASHPPLFERISRVVPGWDGDFASLCSPQRTDPGPSPAREDEPLLDFEHQAPHLIAAAHLLQETDAGLQQAAREPFSARALLVLWLLDEDQQHREKQRATLLNDLPLVREVKRLQDTFFGLPLEDHLPLFDVCLSTLAALSHEQQKTLAHTLLALRAQLSAHSYRAYCLGSVALRHLAVDHREKKKDRILIKVAVETTVAIVARQGHPSLKEAEQAFASGCQSLSKRGQTLRFPPDSELNVQALDASLSTLVHLPQATRQAVLVAAETVAAHDGIVEPSEAELLRVIAVTLNLATPASSSR